MGRPFLILEQASQLHQDPGTVSQNTRLCGKGGLPIADNSPKPRQRISPLSVLFRKLLGDFEKVVETIPVIKGDDGTSILS
jgi:hypothetical protein